MYKSNRHDREGGICAFRHREQTESCVSNLQREPRGIPAAAPGVEDGPRGAPAHRLRDPGAARPQQGAADGAAAAAGGPAAQGAPAGGQVGPRSRWARGRDGFAGTGGNTLVLQSARFSGGAVRGAERAPAAAAQGRAHGGADGCATLQLR